ncbi:MAG: matrixin family metalloprotease [Acidobacteria bacterium]|nr:matrixin family metalloprotease [Acidobacteriota bacterium]
MNEAFTSSDSIYHVEPENPLMVLLGYTGPVFLASPDDLGTHTSAFLRVRAVSGDSSGDRSGWSAPVQGRIAGTPPPPPPPSVSNLSVFGLIVSGTPSHYTRIQDALVGVTNLDTLEMEAFGLSNQHGGYRFPDLDGERYRVNVAALGYQQALPKYARSGAGTDEVQLDFWLTPDEAAPAVNRRYFRRYLWDELGFDTHACPTEDDCPDYWVHPDGSTSAIDPLIDRFLLVLPDTSPNFHIRTGTMSSTWARRIRDAIPGIVSELTGEHYGGQITSGRYDVDEPGWITIEASTEEEDPDTWESGDEDRHICGWARIGAIAGRVLLNKDRVGLSASRSRCGLWSVLAHEIGHAFGFFHVSDDDSLMAPSIADTDEFTRTERYHTQLAYAYGRYTPYFAGPQSTMATQTLGPRDYPVIACPMRH